MKIVKLAKSDHKLFKEERERISNSALPISYALEISENGPILRTESGGVVTEERTTIVELLITHKKS